MGRAKPAVPELAVTEPAVTEASHGYGQADDERNDKERNVVQEPGAEIATQPAPEKLHQVEGSIPPAAARVWSTRSVTFDQPPKCCTPTQKTSPKPISMTAQ